MGVWFISVKVNLLKGVKHIQVIIFSILYSYFMPVCSIVKTIAPRCRGRPDALLREAKGMKLLFYYLFQLMTFLAAFHEWSCDVALLQNLMC